MGIPFVQYLLPHGRTRGVHINRPGPVEALARFFLKSGGRYEAEILRTGEVSFTAVRNGEDVAVVVCPNGPQVPAAVDELVRRSVSKMTTIGR